MPDKSDGADVKSDGGEGKWQLKRIKKPLTDTVLAVLAGPGRGKAIVDGLKLRESEKGRKLEVHAEDLGPVSGDAATGGDIDWKYPWMVRIGNDWRLQTAVATVAHEVKHNEQWYVRFGQHGQTKDGDPAPMDEVETASFEIPAKRTEAQVASNIAVAAVAEAGKNDEVYGTLTDDAQKRREALDWSRSSATGVEASALANASIFYASGQDVYDWHFFLPYLVRYARDRFKDDVKALRCAQALLAKDNEILQPMKTLSKSLGWVETEPEFLSVQADAGLERTKLQKELRDTAQKHVAWFDAERKRTRSSPQPQMPGASSEPTPVRPDTAAGTARLDEAVARLLDLRDKSKDQKPY